MNAVLRPAAIYFALLLVFRLTGRRSIGDITTFDFLLLLVISEALSSALLADDHSITAALIASITLVGLDVALSLAKRFWPALDQVLDDEPVVLFLNGRLQQERLHKERVSEDDILEAARQAHGIDSLDDIRCAVLERRGKISVMPRRSGT
ncbi:MAG: YetF domain-containing protein [Gemmatimonadales bacterium]